MGIEALALCFASGIRNVMNCCYLIDVRDWTRRGMLEPHAESTEVCYPRRDGSIGNGVIGLAWTKCSLGGSRAWFLCPQCEQKWLSKIGLADKWRTCSDGRQKRLQKESSNEKAQKEPHGGIQGESRRRRVERRQDVG
jgi:hypothetical protein